MNFKGQLITECKGKIVRFKSWHISGPTNAPKFRSIIYIGGKEVISHIFEGSKTTSEQALAEKYLNKLKDSNKINTSSSSSSPTSSISQTSQKHSISFSGSLPCSSESISLNNELEEYNTANKVHQEKDNSVLKEEIGDLKKEIKLLLNRINLLEENNRNIVNFMTSSSDNIIISTQRLNQIESFLNKQFQK